MSEPDEVTEGGSPVYRYDDDSEVEAELSSGDPVLIDAVTGHIERHIGPVERIFHEVVSPTVHVDVHWVAPSRERPWHVLVTSGMAERAMTVPEGMEESRYAELLVSLPADWPIGSEAWRDESSYWPVRWLKRLARFPHEHGTWLGWGHTIPNDDPPAPFAANTELACMLLLTPISYPEAFDTLEVADGRRVNFWSLVPIYREEMELKLRSGTEALTQAFDRAGVDEVIDPRRRNVARRRWWRR